MAEKHYYIRFGGIPKDEHSLAWSSQNEIIGDEPGVSVYDAVKLDDGYWHLIIPTPITESTIDTMVSLITYQHRQAFLVEGEYAGRGSGNEPCIRNVRIVENITEQLTLQHSRSHWKPTEKQMKALRAARATFGVDDVVLASLIYDLEKLMK